MFGPHQETPNNDDIAAMRETREQLQELLEMLFKEPFNLDILTWETIKDRYTRSGLGRQAQDAIAQAQRIIRATGRHEQIGWCEFSIGLIYLQWGFCFMAERQFALARQHWLFVNSTAAVCLSQFAEGRVHQHARQNEKAMISYRLTRRCLDRFKYGIHSKEQLAFFEKLTELLETAVASLQDDLWPHETGQKDAASNGSDGSQQDRTPQATTPDWPGPIPEHPSQNGNLKWYKVDRRRVDGFLPQIESDAWVLVRQTVEKQAIVPNELIVVNEINLNSSIWLIDNSAEKQRQPRIALARMVTPKSPFRRDPVTGVVEFGSQIQISPGRPNVIINVENILGVVLGMWLDHIGTWRDTF